MKERIRVGQQGDFVRALVMVWNVKGGSEAPILPISFGFVCRPGISYAASHLRRQFWLFLPMIGVDLMHNKV